MNTKPTPPESSEQAQGLSDNEMALEYARGRLAWLEESVSNAGCEIDYSVEGDEDCVYNRRAEDAESALATAGVPKPQEAVGEVVFFGGDRDLKEVAWVKGKLPPVGTKLFAHPTAQASEGDARDAARYRWLRDGQHQWDVYMPTDKNASGIAAWHGWHRADDKDALIDAALSATATAKGAEGG